MEAIFGEKKNYGKALRKERVLGAKLSFFSLEGRKERRKMKVPGRKINTLQPMT